MPSAPRSPEKQVKADDLARANQRAGDAEIYDLAAQLADADEAHVFGANEFPIRALALKIAAQAGERHLGQRNGYRGASVTCSHCGQAAEFHSHRGHAPVSLVGPVRISARLLPLPPVRRGVLPVR